MDYKVEIENLLKNLKFLGFDRRVIEETMDYRENYIDQLLSKGGNSRFYKRLIKFYYEKSNITNECKEVTGTEFEKLRLSRKLNQFEMAEELGISQQVYSNIETGRTKKIDYETYQLFIQFRNTKNTLNPMDTLKQPDVTLLINSNNTLVNTNAQLVQMFAVSNKKENAPVSQHVSLILLPYLQRIALAGIGRFWDSESEGMIILNTIVIEPLDLGQELGKQAGSDN